MGSSQLSALGYPRSESSQDDSILGGTPESLEQCVDGLAFFKSIKVEK